jgi:hypothetical protein
VFAMLGQSGRDRCVELFTEGDAVTGVAVDSAMLPGVALPWTRSAEHGLSDLIAAIHQLI